MGCCQSKRTKTTAWCKKLTVLASGTPCEYALSTSLLPSYASMDIPLISRQLLLFVLLHGWVESALIGSFTVSEVEALHQLFKKLSSSVIGDGFISKEDLQFALFRNNNKKNLFANRMFDLFDVKCDGVIEFGEFVQSLGVFHPNSPVEEKIYFAFRLYDLRQTGFIEQEELKEMVVALLQESDLELSDDVVQTIVDKTFSDADSKGDGKIDPEEWKEFVLKNPSIIKNMTLPFLKITLITIIDFQHDHFVSSRDVTMAFPSFVLISEVGESEM
ncbi:hypothetical protein D5086_027805 [Populus alba]|uniref:Uncharacterized protein n=1 Tax=Populus alba TaxID=43335 RepID=A0ACC4AWY0_POPAL